MSQEELTNGEIEARKLEEDRKKLLKAFDEKRCCTYCSFVIEDKDKSLAQIEEEMLEHNKKHHPEARIYTV